LEIRGRVGLLQTRGISAADDKRIRKGEVGVVLGVGYFPAMEKEDSALAALQERQLRILASIQRLSSLLLLPNDDSQSATLNSQPGILLKEYQDGPTSAASHQNHQNVATLSTILSSPDKQLGVEQQLAKILTAAGATGFTFKRVPSNYYERSFEERRDLLGATSIDHLCKSIVMVNTQADASVKDCSDRKNSKYYVIVVQYTARLNAEKVRQFVHSLNEGRIPKKRFNLRLAPEEESNRLTGFEHNAVTPIGMHTDIPVILSDAIVKLEPDYFWLGGGEVDLKLGIKTLDFTQIVKPFITDCTYSNDDTTIC
jgi:prolyl-tRNA editing enzyme YbaK/EbsC (Cys-tRNA(Pro) deacylase)